MNSIDIAYKLGSRTAVGELTAWLQNDDGNPTAYPKRRGSILKTAAIDTGGGMGERPQPVSPQLKIPSWAQDEPMGASATRQGVSDAFSGVRLPSFGQMAQRAQREEAVDPWANERGARSARPAARPSPGRAAGSNAAASAFTPDPSQMSMAPKSDVFTGGGMPANVMTGQSRASPMSMAKSDVFTGEPSSRGMSMAPKAAPAAMASKSDSFAGGSGMPADVMTGQSRMPAAPAAQAKAPPQEAFTGNLPQSVQQSVRKTAAAIRKMANIMTPNPNVTTPSAQTQPAGNPAAKAIGNPAPGGGGAAPVTPPPAGSSGPKVAAAIQRVKTAIMGGKSQTCKDMPEVCNPGGGGTPLPPSPPPKPVTPPPKTAADHAVEQVMRKLGKSMSRRPLSRDGTKFEAIKKKLRKQKSKK